MRHLFYKTFKKNWDIGLTTWLTLGLTTWLTLGLITWLTVGFTEWVDIFSVNPFGLPFNFITGL